MNIGASVHAILANVTKHIDLTVSEKDYFTNLLTLQQVPRKTLILNEGDICDAINYIYRGAFRAYYRDRDGNESVVMFGIDDWWITDMFSFAMKAPAILHIESIEQSTILVLKKDALDQLFIDVPKFERFFRIILQNSYIREQLRTVQNLSMDARQRYEYFTGKYPQQVQRIPQKYIASYLGITPEFLSTIRKRRN